MEVRLVVEEVAVGLAQILVLEVWEVSEEEDKYGFILGKYLKL